MKIRTAPSPSANSMLSVMLVAHLDGLTGVRGENVIMTVVIPMKKIIKKDFENVIDAGIRKISKILENNVVLGWSNQVREHYVVDINLKCVMKQIALTVIIVHVTWNAYGQIGANGVNALQSVATDIA